MQINSMNDTVFIGRIFNTPYGTVQNNYDRKGHLILCDSSIFDIGKKSKYSTTIIYDKDTTIIKSITHFDALRRKEKVELLDKKGKIEQTFNYSYIIKNNNTLTDTIIQKYTCDERESYSILIFKKIYK